MSIAAVLAAAEPIAEPSKTAFYVVGGALAACAVLLAIVGISRPAFPGGRNGEVALRVAAVVLVAAAMATSVITA